MENQPNQTHLEPGSRHSVTVESVAYGGSGIAKINHLIVFVPYTMPGDAADIEITEVKPNFAKAKMVQITALSAQRCQPKCEFFGTCGGCQYQHIAYEHQLHLKGSQVRDLFQRIGNFPNAPVSDMIPSELNYGYRIKAEFHLKSGHLGYFANDNRTILDIPACPLVDEKINQQLAQVWETLRKQYPKYVPDPIILWASIYEQKHFDIFDPHATPRFISRKIMDKIFNVPYAGFFQVNHATSEKLVSAVIDLCELTGEETVLDAYCGCGLFTLFLAEKARNVVGIELDKDSAYGAVVNAKNYECRNIRIIKGTVEEKISEIVQLPDRGPTTVILDPPRTGCSREILDALAAVHPQRIVYISCDPATQARDARFLVEHGFDLIKIQPFDMFPQTRHIEVVCVFDKN